MNNPLLPNENESPDNAPSFNDNEIPAIPVSKRNKTSWVQTYWDEKIQEINNVPRQVIVCKVIDTSDQTRGMLR